ALNLLITYAFSFLKLHQLYVHVSETNEASLKLFTRCSFLQTGVLRNWITSENGYTDVIVMQRINENS
ncbi:MAG: GNAT family protein, partial [Parabacteroides sp.]|nr:GNAT family protein [Parabacteroides sp.]